MSSACGIVWTRAQVPPGKAVITSEVILFGRTAFLIRDTVVCGKDEPGGLSRMPGWVDSVGAVCAS